MKDEGTRIQMKDSNRTSISIPPVERILSVLAFGPRNSTAPSTYYIQECGSEATSKEKSHVGGLGPQFQESCAGLYYLICRHNKG